MDNIDMAAKLLNTVPDAELRAKAQAHETASHCVSIVGRLLAIARDLDELPSGYITAGLSTAIHDAGQLARQAAALLDKETNL